MIAVGSKAPDFTLSDHNGKQVKLSELKGRKVLLSFHPLAWTSVCAEQMKSLEANFAEFEKLNTVAFGLSIDSVPCKKAWAKELAVVKTSLLCDFWPHGGVAKLYDIFREKDGFSERGNIVVDEGLRVTFAQTYPISQLPDIGEIIRFLRGKG